MKNGELNTSTPVMSPDSNGLVEPNTSSADGDHSKQSISDCIDSSRQEQEQKSGNAHEVASDDPVQPNLSVQAKYDSKENLSYFIDDGMHIRKISKSDIINISNNDLSSLDTLYADDGNTKVVTIKHGVTAQIEPKHPQKIHESKSIHRSLSSKKGSPSQTEAILDKKVDFVQRNKESVKTGASTKNKQREAISSVDKRKEISKSIIEDVQHLSWEPKIATPFSDVQDMEQVRGHIQEMLHLSSNTSVRMPYDMTDAVSGLLQTPANDFFPLSNTSLLQGQTSADVSQFLDAMPSFTSRLWSEGINMSRNETSVALENQKLKDTFEKERYRRKHCEHYIQQLNVRLLETQQQLAIAVSTDKRKDLMIEQLDKQLAKVVEGWRKREREKEEYGTQLKQKNQNLEQKLKKQEQIIASFERDLASSIEDLARERKSSLDSSNQLKKEIESCIKGRHSLEDQIRSEREKARLLSVEWDKMREQADRTVDGLHEKLHWEQGQWYQQEQELVKKLEEFGAASLEAVQHEKNKCEEKMIYIQELDAQFEVRKLEMELDSSTREKESLRVEIGIMESKYENDKRNLKSQMDQEMSEKLIEVHGEMKTCRLDLQENHRQQVATQNQFQEEMKKKDDVHRRQDQEYEERLRDFRNENSALKLTKQKLETQRAEALTKMQYMMQYQWSEAMSLLSSPQKERQSRVPENVPNLSYSVVGRGAGPQTSSPNRESMVSQFTINSASGVRQSLALQPQQHEIQEEPAEHESTIDNFLNRPHDLSSKQPGARKTDTSSSPPIRKTAPASKTKLRQPTQQQSGITDSAQRPRESSADRGHMTKDNRTRKPERKVAQGRTKSNTTVKSWK